MENFKFRTLEANEIDCRVGTVTDKGVSLLMYKDARVDMRLLDEVVGSTNWKREHELINGNLFCVSCCIDCREDNCFSRSSMCLSLLFCSKIRTIHRMMAAKAASNK